MHSNTRQRIYALKCDEHVLGNLNKSVQTTFLRSLRELLDTLYLNLLTYVDKYAILSD